MPAGDDTMKGALAKLSAAIDREVAPFRDVMASEHLARFHQLEAVGADLYERFERAEKALPPPQEKRREAINKFRNLLPLNPTEWRLVFAGMADKSERVGPILEDAQLFGRVHNEVSLRIEERRLSRRDWLALCFSYFGYESDTPDVNANWCVLRGDIQQGFACVKAQQTREKEWMRIVQHHQEVFSSKAGDQLGERMFNGEISDLSALQTIAQIPDSSWLWRRIFTVLLSRIFTLDDAELSQRLPDLVDIGRQHTRYMNDVLSACLARYHLASYREKPSSLLKQAALDNWGSPQIRSRQNSWLQYVEKDVCAMVVAWFAKEDLEHFFNLLKGDADVDQARLFYWLRYANQMSYTRIVLGGDAKKDSSSDFVDFRKKNSGRLSYLVGGKSSNNAVIMQIGNYLFVEFSETGNACYVYEADGAPFNSDQKFLDLNLELKQKARTAVKPMGHMAIPNRPNHVSGWLVKFDQVLAKLGIHIQDQSTLPNNQSLKSSLRTESFEAQLEQAMTGVRHKVFDHRSKGGAYQVQLDQDDPTAKVTLQRLGFKPVNHQPLRFWRS